MSYGTAAPTARPAASTNASHPIRCALHLADPRVILDLRVQPMCPGPGIVPGPHPLVQPRPRRREDASVRHRTCGAGDEAPCTGVHHVTRSSVAAIDIENQFHLCHGARMPDVWRFIPLAGVLVFFGLGIGVRTWLHARRYGSSGVVLFRGSAPSERLLGALGLVVPMALLVQATAAAVAPQVVGGAIPESFATVLRPLGASLLFGGALLMFVAQLDLGAS